MVLKVLKAEEVALPSFASHLDAKITLAQPFSLSSHARAREALELALGLPELGFNVFVLGDDRSGRMTATLSYLRQQMAKRSAPDDWVYLSNFRRLHRPKPVALPAGRGRELRESLGVLLNLCRNALKQALETGRLQRDLQGLYNDLQSQINSQLENLRQRAEAQDLQLVQTEAGLALTPAPDASGQLDPNLATSPAAQSLQEELRTIGQQAAKQQADLARKAQSSAKQVAEAAIAGFFFSIGEQFKDVVAVARWLEEMRSDLLENLEAFQQGDPFWMRRYAINLIVDHADTASPEVVVEAEPSFESLFGRIEYQQVAGSYVTDHSLIRPGALHRANGGLLVLRAEAIAREPDLWDALKGALRDEKIRVGILHRANQLPIAGAPDPKAVPLKVKVVLVGAPSWFYSFFAVDPEFRAYFKIKADISPDLKPGQENLAIYRAMIGEAAAQLEPSEIEAEACDLLLSLAARKAERRDRLTARFEILSDILVEAALTSRRQGKSTIGAEDILATFSAQYRRNGQVEDRMQEAIEDQRIMIDTLGSEIGQINGLTVQDYGDHSFGLPARITARASVGREGLVNIERDVDMGGPIQQKAVMVIDGFLAGHFARSRPLSFNCSLTFEQNYGGVEGDSASLAELLAVLSDLAQVPLRQDIAVTGSVNQRGEIQVVGGVTHKVEGFYRACRRAGELTGEQGVLLPAKNAINLVLMPEVSKAIEAGQFHIWTADSVEDAIRLLTGMEPGEMDKKGGYPSGTLYREVAHQLDRFNEIMAAARSQ